MLKLLSSTIRFMKSMPVCSGGSSLKSGTGGLLQANKRRKEIIISQGWRKINGAEKPFTRIFLLDDPRKSMQVVAFLMFIVIPKISIQKPA